jgi:hypothetical protein
MLMETFDSNTPSGTYSEYEICSRTAPSSVRYNSSCNKINFNNNNTFITDVTVACGTGSTAHAMQLQ